MEYIPEGMVLLGPGCNRNEVIAAERILKSMIPDNFFVIVKVGQILGVDCDGNPNRFILAFTSREEAEDALAVKKSLRSKKRNAGAEIKAMPRNDMEKLMDLTGRTVMIDPDESLTRKATFFDESVRVA